MAKKKKRTYHRRRRKLSGLKLKKETVHAVAALWLWFFAILIIISYFAEGSVLEVIKSYIIDFIGWLYYLLPIFIISLSLLFFKIKSDIGKPTTPGGIALMLAGLAGISRAGFSGEYLWNFASNALSGQGAILVFLIVIIIGLIILSNASLESFLNFIIEKTGNLTGSLFAGKRDTLKEIRIMGGDRKETMVIKGSTDEEKPARSLPVTAGIVAGKNPEIQKKIPGADIMIHDSMNQPKISIASWKYPPFDILSDGPGSKADRGDVRKNAGIIEETLGSFGIRSKVVEVNNGPAVTQYALRIPLGTKVSKVTSLSSDLAMVLSAPTGQVRIEAPIPGRDLVGIEIPNRGLEFVTLKKMLNSPAMTKSKSHLSVALGLDVSGSPLIADIGKMPHVLIAGTTGSGKSVLVNTWICSLLFRTRPDQVKLILVDPKRVELTGYNGVPHLLTPVIVEPDKIVSSLRWAMGEMDKRYKQFAEVGVRNIDSFNEMSGFQAMPYIIIFIDELADLMAYAPVEVEDSICRIAQMARATGIHLVLATQRPSVDVITGLIKANIPSRIAFNVSSMVDSRVIIDMPGAEKLLGRGDMLYIPADQSKPSRIQGTFVSEHEVKKVVDFLHDSNPPAQYTDEVLSQPVSGGKKGSLGGLSMGDGKDTLFDDALKLICQHDKASASLLQRRMSVGYARAARILDQLEEAGIVGPAEGSKPRDVLFKSPEEYYATLEQTAAGQLNES